MGDRQTLMLDIGESDIHPDPDAVGKSYKPSGPDISESNRPSRTDLVCERSKPLGTLMLWVADKPSSDVSESDRTLRPNIVGDIDNPSRLDRICTSLPAGKTFETQTLPEQTKERERKRERDCKDKDAGNIYGSSKPEGPDFSRRRVISRLGLEAHLKKHGF